MFMFATGIEPCAIEPAEIMNGYRFLSLDLNYGFRVDSEIYEYLMDNAMTHACC